MASTYLLVLLKVMYINVAAYREVHCKSKCRESEFFHSYQEFDSHKLHPHFHNSNQSFAEELVFLGQVLMWRKVSHPGWQVQNFHLDNANALYSDSNVGRVLYRTGSLVQSSVQYCCLGCCMHCDWVADEALVQHLCGKIAVTVMMQQSLHTGKIYITKLPCRQGKAPCTVSTHIYNTSTQSKSE